MRRSVFPTCFLLVCITVSVSIAADSAFPAALQADILALMELTGAINVGKQLGAAALQQSIAHLRQSQPDAG
jgi:hypothetical protein